MSSPVRCSYLLDVEADILAASLLYPIVAFHL